MKKIFDSLFYSHPYFTYFIIVLVIAVVSTALILLIDNTFQVVEFLEKPVTDMTVGELFLVIAMTFAFFSGRKSTK